VLSWLAAQGYAASNPTLSQVDYGFEICTTDGQPAHFGVTSYSLSAS
jgi:hypothetical protein